MYDARCVANEFIRRANACGSPRTHLQIQKLVYFAHARLLVIHGEPLISQRFEAWEYGPVVAVLYHDLKRNGADGVEQDIPTVTSPAYSSRETDIFDWCFNQYGHQSGPKLTTLTHANGSPWSVAASVGENVISNDTIADYYAAQWEGDFQTELKRINKNPAVQRLVMESLNQNEVAGSCTLGELKQRLGSHVSPSS